MSTHVLTDAALWIGDVAVAAQANTLNWDSSRETQDSTTFGQGARTMKPGLETLSVSADGFADLDTVDDRLSSLYEGATVTPLSASPTGEDGDVAYTSQGLIASLQPIGGSVGDLAAVTVQADGSGGIKSVRGNILHPETAETATGDGTARQLGAAGSEQRVYAALHVVEVSGTSPTLDVTVDSDDAEAFSAPTTQITFAQATGSTSEFASAAGAITDDWWRVSFTIGGTSPSFTFVVVVGIR